MRPRSYLDARRPEKVNSARRKFGMLSGMNDPFHLRRFVEAQDPIYAQVCDELRNGTKRSHWMWFIFPQIAGFGFSSMARRFAISSLEEAKAYLRHPVLGARLVECAELVLRIKGRRVRDIFGYPDDLKFRSSMTLFAQANPDAAIFKEVLQKYFAGESDPQTLALL
jgi:uncharacterized protein (DUF1810 family)